MNKEANEEVLKTVIDGIFNAFDEDAIKNFDINFPNVRNRIKTCCENNPFDIATEFDSIRLEFEVGTHQFMPLLKKSNNKIYNLIIDGIFDGTFIDALRKKCRNTDMVRKFFKAVYKELTTGEIVNVYEEYTKEQITEWYNSSKWAQKIYKTLDNCLNDYVGKPDMSLEEFKTSNDIINWFFQIQVLYDKMCKIDLRKIKFDTNEND